MATYSSDIFEVIGVPLLGVNFKHEIEPGEYPIWVKYMDSRAEFMINFLHLTYEREPILIKLRAGFDEQYQRPLSDAKGIRLTIHSSYHQHPGHKLPSLPDFMKDFLSTELFERWSGNVHIVEKENTRYLHHTHWEAVLEQLADYSFEVRKKEFDRSYILKPQITDLNLFTTELYTTDSGESFIRVSGMEPFEIGTTQTELTDISDHLRLIFDSYVAGYPTFRFFYLQENPFPQFEEPKLLQTP